MNQFQFLPILHEPPDQVLGVDSTLAELPLYQFQVEATLRGVAIAPVFEQFPQLPGVVLWSQNQLLGMISRHRLLECLLRPHGLDVLLPEPLQVLYSYIRCEHLILSPQTPIRVAAPMVLRRSPELYAEPLLVRNDDETYYLLDVHELNKAYWQIRGIETQVRYERIQTQMIQTEKMASLGRLVDGVAHEILDPVGFIWGNLTHVSGYTEQLLELLTTYEEQSVHSSPAIQKLKEEIELDYLKWDLPRAIESICTGADRLKKLAASLQNFCHMDEVYPKPANLHECLDSVILLLKSRLSREIQITRCYGHLPPVTCYIGQLNQVFMNLLAHRVNGLLNQAIAQEWTEEFGGKRAIAPHSKPQITITTQIRSTLPASAGIASSPISKPEGVGRWVSICIADNGPGFSQEQQQHFWKALRAQERSVQETSLSLSYQIVTARHGGKLLMRSPIPLPSKPAQPEEASDSHPVGVGNEFEILLPLV